MRATVLLLLLMLLVGAAVGPGVFAPEERADDELVLVSPHWDGIRIEFGRAFAEEWKAKTGRTVKVVWLDLGGGGMISKYVYEQASKARWDRGEGIGVDIFFGGGTFEYEQMCDEKSLARRNIALPGGMLAAHALPAEFDAEIPPKVNGQTLRDDQGRWYAACMSGFGFVYNKEVVARAGLPEPATWRDLGRPELRGWISCGDPAQSGSLQMAFEIMLQAYTWDEGWGVLTRMVANAPAFNEGGASIPRDVSLGQAAAGPCIDFYAAAPMRRQGATHLEFVFPKGLSVVTPDPIAIFRNAPHPRVAGAFVDFVLSRKGQMLWYVKRGLPGGPASFDLERLPVWKSLYEQTPPLETYALTRPFEEGEAFAYDGRKGGKRWSIMKDFLRATLVDVHEDLKQAWMAVIAHGRADDLGQALGRPAVDEETLLKIGSRGYPQAQLNRLRNRWTGWARARFQAIKRAAETNGPVPEYKPGPSEP
ncbi:MAG: extracellular solute-binding protein [Planctomycetota bacterium]|nr:extracellular solute-binding protein [Planctomycetota bacterium]